MVTTPEKIVLPGGGDLFDYVEEMRKKAASQRTIVPVADITEADAIAVAMASEGRPVTDANPLVVWDNSMKEYNYKNASGWANSPWQSLTLQGAWVPYVGGGGYYSGLRCRKKDGQLLLHGMVKSGAAASNISTLPAGFFPAYTTMQVAEVNAAGTFGVILASNFDGLVSYRAGVATPAYVMINMTMPMY